MKFLENITSQKFPKSVEVKSPFEKLRVHQTCSELVEGQIVSIRMRFRAVARSQWMLDQNMPAL
jgi:hypothetical protein